MKVTDFNNTWCKYYEDNKKIIEEEISELDKMKEKYESGDYICLYKDAKWNKCIPMLDNSVDLSEFELIHKTHKDILDAYLKDNNIEIQYEVDVYNKDKFLKTIWNNLNPNDFIETYHETVNYRLAVKEEEKMEENSFNKFGFETPDFEGEILKEFDSFYLGYIVENMVQEPIKWSKKGKWVYFEISEHASTGGLYNLTPLKKNWWEKKENIGKLVRYDYFDTYELGIFLGVNKDKNWLEIATLDGTTCQQKYRKCKPATKEEVLSLWIEE